MLHVIFLRYWRCNKCIIINRIITMLLNKIYKMHMFQYSVLCVHFFILNLPIAWNIPLCRSETLVNIIFIFLFSNLLLSLKFAHINF